MSDDTGEQVEVERPADDTRRSPAAAWRGSCGISARAASRCRPAPDSPVGAGIAGSSALIIAVCGRAGGLDRRRPDGDEDLLAVAMNIEAQVIDVPTGVQDYRPALYGGISAVELGVTGVRRVRSTSGLELERRIVLAYTGASRNSGINNWDVMKRHIDGDASVPLAFAHAFATSPPQCAAARASRLAGGRAKRWPPSGRTAKARARRDDARDRRHARA